MKVKFKQKWFCADAPFDSYGRVFIGRLFRRGVHELPDHMLDDLPKKPNGKLVDWIEILDGEVVDEEAEYTPTTLSEIGRRNEEMDRLQNQIKEILSKGGPMAKAHAAKVQKKIDALKD